MKSMVLLLLVHCAAGTVRTHRELLGYLENWDSEDTIWWSNDLPGNCLMGCEKPEPYMAQLQNYTSLNYGFTFLTTDPSPDQNSCTTATCKTWNGKAIYMAASSKQGAAAVTAATTISDLTPGIVTIGEACRLARMNEWGPRRCKISLGGWSDWARIGSSANAAAIASLVGKLVAFTFSDGIDLDFEHLSTFSNQTLFPGDDEFTYFAELIVAIRKEFETVSTQWVTMATARKAALAAAYAKLQPWQKKTAQYYPTNMQYLDEVIANGAPQPLEISFTTRFNAFLPTGSPYNYLLPDSIQCVGPGFASDNEGKKLWPSIGAAIDTVNIMSYDASCNASAPLKLNFTQILLNFAAGGVPKMATNIGFEPGEQAAGAVWPGIDADVAAAKDVARLGFGGAIVWALNPDPKDTPLGHKYSQMTAAAVGAAMGVQWPYGSAPKYSIVDKTTGWITNSTYQS